MEKARVDPIRGYGRSGQRFEVRGVTHANTEVVVGWTNERDGGGVAKAIEAAPLRFKSVRVVDLDPLIEKLLVNWREWKAGCRKCMGELIKGKRSCAYCSHRFPEQRAK